MIRRAAPLAALLAIAATLALGASPAAAFRGHVFGSTFGEAGSGPGQLKEPSAVAVDDATGRVYVLDQGNARIEYFSSTGTFEGTFDGTATPAGSFDFGAVPLSGGIAVDNSCYLHQPRLTGLACEDFDPSNGDVYVTDPGHTVVDKFSAAGAYLGQLEEACGLASCPAFEFTGAEAPLGVAIDPQGTIWIYQEGTRLENVNGEVVSFANRAGNPVTSETLLSHVAHGTPIHNFTCPGFAVDSGDNFYARRGGNQPSCDRETRVTQYESSGEGSITPFADEETSAVAVDQSNDEVFLDNLTSIGAFSSAGAPQERFGTTAQLTAGAGLAVGPAANPLYSTVYVADVAADRIAIFPPEPPNIPLIQSASVNAVTADSATLSAEVNPRSEPGEAPTEYLFEYGPCQTALTCASSPFESSAPIPAGRLGADFELHPAAAHLQGLLPATVYHFRALAENSHGAAPAGEELVFTTQAPAPFALPDGRGWELVSPPDKHGAALRPIGAGTFPIQAAAAGDAIAYAATAPTEAEPLGNSNRTEVLSTRGPAGWSSLDLTVPHPIATGASIGEGEEYRAFSTDLSTSILQPLGAFEPLLSPQATEQTAFSRTDFPAGDTGAPCSVSCYRPLVTGAEGVANVPEGTVFGEEGECPKPQHLLCGPRFLGGSPDLSHVVVRSKIALTTTPLPAGAFGLYEFSAASSPDEALRLVSVLPGGGAKPVRGTPELGSSKETDQRDVISPDGSRVIWSFEKHLYLRYNATAEQSALNGSGECTEVAMSCTIQLDTIQGGPGTGEVNAVFQLASADGSRVFFTDHQRLTADSGAAEGEGNADLYEYDLEKSPGERLTDLTPVNPEAESAQVQGLAIGASADGSSLYFVANGKLSGEEENVEHEKAMPGQPNLYLSRGGTTTFIATLTGADNPDWGGKGESKLANLTARVSLDGRWIAFMSDRPLTRYDNRDAVSERSDQEVFLYHAPSGQGQGTLVCASCNPTGARPRGMEFSAITVGNGGLAGGSVWPESTWLAANVPTWTSYTLNQSLYQSRYLSDSGRLFFNSSDALVPSDTNGTEDVYQYEPPGVGGCTASSLTFGPASQGCVDLISSGISKQESAFLDASESGDDVFFLTASQLSHRDLDTALDVYDAGVGGSETEAARPVECSGDACQQPAVPPNDATPGSLTFNGAGNVVECPKGNVKKPGKCVAKKHKHHKKSKKRHAKPKRGSGK